MPKTFQNDFIFLQCINHSFTHLITHPSISMYTHRTIHPSIFCLAIHHCLFFLSTIHPSIHPFNLSSIHQTFLPLSIKQSIIPYPSIHPSIFLTINLTIHSSILLSGLCFLSIINPSIHLSTYLSRISTPGGVQGKPGGLSKTPATRPTVCSLCCPQGDVSAASDPALADWGTAFSLRLSG